MDDSIECSDVDFFVALDLAIVDMKIHDGQWVNDKLKFYEIVAELHQLIASGVQVPPEVGTGPFWAAYDSFNCLDKDDERVDEEPQPGCSHFVDQLQIGGARKRVQHPPSHFYKITESEPENLRKFNTSRHHFEVDFLNTEELGPVNVDGIFDDILQQLLSNTDSNDLVGMQISHPAMDKDIFLPFRKKGEFTGEVLLHEIERVQQSKTELSFDGKLRFIITIVQSPQGGRGNSDKRLNITCNWQKWFDSHCGHGGCFIQIKNTDQLCLARAVVTAKAKVDNDPKLETILKGDQGRNTCEQKRRAQALMVEAGLQAHQGPCGMAEIQKIQAVLPKEYQLKIFSKDFHALIYQGEVAPQVLHLYNHDNHFTVICSMPAFFADNYWCDPCNKAYSHKDQHRCRTICPCCYGADCPNNPALLQLCNDCNRYFRGPQCFFNHKKTHVVHSAKRQKIETSVCTRIQCCKDCGKHSGRNVKNKHQCGYFKCRICRKDVLKEGHQCYMQPLAGQAANVNEDEHALMDDDDEEIQSDAAAGLKESREQEPPSFVFFDFETRQEKEVGRNEQGPICRHEPNLCIAHIVCDKCRSQPMGLCTKCGPNRMVFEGIDCQGQFCTWLFKDTRRNIIAVAHNAKGFDGQFLLKHLTQNGIKPDIINKGLELMSLSVGKIKVIDSLNFMPMALSALPKAFGEEELAKGWFPHLFNRTENEHYVGPWPEAHYYSPDSMKVETRQAFIDWHEQQKDKIFDFHAELFKYCESDVDILRRCSLKFRDIFLSKTGMDPFLNSLTIAGACNRVFRQLFLKENTIAIIPHGGYRRKEKQSLIAIKWLKWISHTENIDIIHARNMGEYHIGPYKVDGICGQTVYELYGCYWHGCPACMKTRHQMTADGSINAQEAFERTITRQKYIENQGYTVVAIWECQLNKELKQNEEMRAFFEDIQQVTPLDPRAAFFGGRTNAVKLFEQIQKDARGWPLERIDYSDICSLYPYVCKYGKFPVGHPKIYTENFQDLSTQPYEGIIKCLILPPRNLLHPLLPFKCNRKLTFPLCRTCAVEQVQDKCTHSVEQRALDGEWISLEVYKAMELGYQVLKVHEVWHYERVEQFDRETNPDGGLFTEYINTFIKIKQQADGWPAWVKTNDNKAQYIADYKEHEFVQLDEEDIVKNPGLRALSKLMLNSFWGKFGQRNNMAKMQYFTKPDEYYKHIFEAGRIVHSIVIISDSMVAVTSTMEDELVQVMGNTNAVIAAYTTAQARLKLYSYIEQLGDRLLYFDTDSIIYKSTIGRDEYQVPIGSYLGDMTNELKDYGPGAYIEEFVSGGPKNYAYKVWSPRDNKYSYCIKVRGFSLNYSTSEIVNFVQLKAMVFKFVKNKVVNIVPVNFSRIERTKDRDIVTKQCTKKYRIVYDKRIVQEDYCTYPFGWFY